jgi:hypothetical protein
MLDLFYFIVISERLITFLTTTTIISLILATLISAIFGRITVALSLISQIRSDLRDTCGR